MLKRLLKEQEGQAMVEYALLVALIAIASLFVLLVLGKRIEELYDNLQRFLGVWTGPSRATCVDTAGHQDGALPGPQQSSAWAVTGADPSIKPGTPF